MTLADSEIIITIDGERLALRPTLRAAMRIERQFGGFGEILEGLAEQNVSMMAALVAECSAKPSGLADFLSHDRRAPMAYKVAALVEPLMTLTLHLAGFDAEEARDADGGDRVTYAEHHARLFRLATGWLGWSPDQAWSATPAEIKAAYEGRLEMLKAIFGGSEEPKATEADLAAFMRARAV